MTSGSFKGSNETFYFRQPSYCKKNRKPFCKGSESCKSKPSKINASLRPLKSCGRFSFPEIFSDSDKSSIVFLQKLIFEISLQTFEILVRNCISIFISRICPVFKDRRLIIDFKGDMRTTAAYTRLLVQRTAVLFSKADSADITCLQASLDPAYR